MSTITFFAMAAGVVMSAVCGFTCYSGPAMVHAHVAAVPGLDTLTSYPETGLLIGLGLLVVGIFYHPKQTH